MRGIETGLKNPYVIVVAALAVLVVGVVAATRIPADLLPQFKTPAVQIVTFYPGMAPEVVEGDITSRLERWTGQSVGIERQESKSLLGVSIVKDFFRENISFDTAMSQVTSYAMSDLYYLPPGTVPPMVMPFDPTASVPLCIVTVSSPTLTEKDLYDVAYFELRNRLQSIQGVIAPAVYGGVLRRILAYVDRDKLESRNLSPMDVVRSLRAQNVFVPAGNAKFGDLDYQIISNSMPSEVHELNDIPIKASGNSVVFMRDVGEVKDSAQIQSNIVRINGRRQVYIPVYRQPGANTIAIVDQIKSQLDQIIARLRNLDPKNKDLALSVVMDQSAVVRGSIGGLQFEAALGAILAGAMVLLFLRSIRATVIAVIALPVSFLAAIIGLYATGDTLNSMTLGGLALSVGIILDQAIVVLENIVRRLETGEPRAGAVLHGTQEVALPVLVSVVTFAVAFFPVIFLGGIARFLFTPLAVAVIIAITAGYGVAMFIVPLSALTLLRESGAHGKGGVHEESAGGLGAWSERIVVRLLRRKFAVLAVSAIAFVGGALLLTSLGRELFPPVDASQFTIYVRMPSGTRLEKSEETIARIERTLISELGEPDIDYPAKEEHHDSDLRILISNAGVLYDWPAAYTPNEGPMDAFVLAQLKGKRGSLSTFAHVARLRARLAQEFPGVGFAFDTGGMLTAALNFGLPSPIDIQVQGNSLEVLGDIAGEIRRIAAGVPGAVDVRMAQRNDYPQIRVDVDRVKSAQLGLTQEDVIKNLVTSLNSSIGFNPAFWIDEKNRNHYFLGAQYAEQDIKSIETLLDIPVSSGNGARPTVLRNLVALSPRQGPASVTHMNITRTFNVFAGVLPGHDVGSVAAEIERRLTASEALSPKSRASARGMVYDIKGPKYDGKGYNLAVRGEAQSMRESLRAFSSGMGMAVVLIYLVMVALLKSFKAPMAVMFAIPLGMIGVAVMLYITGSALNIPSAMGILMMSGIVVQFSIILLMFAEQLIAEGAEPHIAVARAVRLRVRPILMTALAACLAMAPMAIGGRGAEANAPLARAIIGGVIAAAGLTIFVVPCLFVILRGSSKARVVVAESGGTH